MKNLVITFLLLFCTSFLYSQNNEILKSEKKGALTEVYLYYENGNIMQHGFYTKEGKLHASWESYNLDGTRKCIATYNQGVKVGTWTYFNENKITKIVYKNGKIESIEEIDSDKAIKKVY